MIYGNYRCDEGGLAGPRWRRDGRRRQCGAAPGPAASPPPSLAMSASSCASSRASAALDVVAQAALDLGMPARSRRASVAAMLLTRLNLPQRLWSLPPATFSGGEQQRVNIARGFVASTDVLLLDEPTASLDATNRAAVVDLIHASKRSRRRHHRHLPRRGRARRKSRTASSTSPALRPQPDRSMMDPASYVLDPKRPPGAARPG